MFITRIIPEGRLKDKLRCFYYNNFKFRNKFYIIYGKDNNFKIKFKNGIFLQICGEPCQFTPNILKGIVGDINNILEGYLSRYQLKNGDIIVDGGAYIGAFTLYAAKVIGDKGKVIAFEPDPQLYKRLEHNIQLNNLTNIIALKKGLWSEGGVLEFNNIHSGSSSFFFESMSVKSIIKVPVVKLDDELKKIGITKIDFIKMDIEGAEIEAIKGCREILENNKVNLAIASYHIVNGQKTSFQLEHLLQEFGYKTKTIFPQHQTTLAFKE